MIIRIDESLYFGNIEQLKDMIARIERLGDPNLHPSAKPVVQPVTGVVVDARNIVTMDAMYVYWRLRWFFGQLITNIFAL